MNWSDGAKGGAGQWFRYLVGILELAGAIGLLIPRLAAPAALGLLGVMIGAFFTQLFVLDTQSWRSLRQSSASCSP